MRTVFFLIALSVAPGSTPLPRRYSRQFARWVSQGRSRLLQMGTAPLRNNLLHPHLLKARRQSKMQDQRQVC